MDKKYTTYTITWREPQAYSLNPLYQNYTITLNCPYYYDTGLMDSIEQQLDSMQFYSDAQAVIQKLML